MPDRQQPNGSPIHLELPGGLRMYARFRPAIRPGSGAGTANALLVHGLGDDHTAFPPPVLDGLGERLDVLVPDLVGFGRTPAPPGFDFSLDAHAAALEAVLSTRPGPTLVIGHSLGGALATRVASRVGAERGASSSIAGIVSVEGNLTEADCFLSRRAVRVADRGKFTRWWSLLPEVMEARATVPRYRATLRRTDAGAYLRTARSLHAETTAGTIAREFTTLRAPTLYVHGDGLAEETLALLAAHDVRRAAFPGAPHWVIEYDPTGFVAAVLDWLEEERLFRAP